MLRTIAPPVLNHLWGKIKDTGIYKKAKRILSDQLGLDLNDDNAGYLGNPFSTNLSIKKNLRWDDFSEDYMNISRGYDGVSAQAVASMLFPELTRSRIPTDIAVRSGLISRS